MDELKVVWTDTAIKQRNAVFRYWNERNKSLHYSRKLNQSIKSRIQLLKYYPQLGRQTTYKNVRSFPLNHYNILYRPEGKTIYILGFWDNRQSPKKLLDLLKQL